MRSAISWFAPILALLAEATFRILPRMGRMACVLRSRACLAEPPALSPSTMNSSVPAGSSLAQSVSLPGRRSLRDEVAVLRFTSRRSEEHTSELQSLMRISYAVFCLKKKKQTHNLIYRHKQKNRQPDLKQHMNI